VPIKKFTTFFQPFAADLRLTDETAPKVFYSSGAKKGKMLNL
jgi:hypothetical protein